MSVIKINNNQGTSLQIDKYGNIVVSGKFTYTVSGAVKEDAPTNSMSAQAIAGGRDGENPPIKNEKSKAIIAAMLRRKMKEC